METEKNKYYIIMAHTYRPKTDKELQADFQKKLEKATKDYQQHLVKLTKRRLAKPKSPKTKKSKK